MDKFKFIPHTADIEFQAFGNSLKECFENSALALKSIVFEGKVKQSKKFKIKVNGKDLENLLYEFLEEFLVLIDSKDFLMSKIKILKFDSKKFELEAEVKGDNINSYETEMHIKAITYHEMFVKKIRDKFIAQVVVDI